MTLAPGIKTGTVSVSAFPHTSWTQLVPTWAELAAAIPRVSFFLTTEWVDVWMQVYGAELSPQVLVFEADHTPVGACLLVHKREWRGPFRIRRVYLNTAGEGDLQSPCAEYNDLLCLAGWEVEVAASLWRHLENRSWDEVEATAFSEGDSLRALQSAFRDAHQDVTLRRCYYIDLASLRRSNSAYEDTLSSKVRQLVRKNLKLYGESAEVRLEPAKDLARARALLDELARLHQKSWIARGQPGVFSAPKFTQFHQRLIDRIFPLGRAQLLRVAAGDDVIGVAYLLVWGGTAYLYLWGLRYSENKRMKPGFVTQIFAVRHAVESGLMEYDLMAGEATYKRELADRYRHVASTVFQRRSVKMHLLERLRTSRRWLRRARFPLK